MAGEIVAQDYTSAPFFVGDYVFVRCKVTSITGTGSGASVALTVQTPGNIGEKTGVTLTVGPTQCKRAGNTTQA